MNTLSESISKLKIRKSTTNYPPTKEEEFLSWIQGEPKMLKATTKAQLARETPILGLSAKDASNLISNLSRRGILFYNKIGNPRCRNGKKNYYINYDSPILPKNIKLRATNEDIVQSREALKKHYADRSNTNELSSTQPAEENPEPKENPEPQEPTEIEISPQEEPIQATIPLNSQTPSSITITLNINFNNGKNS